jgi:hypothetical protein
MQVNKVIKSRVKERGMSARILGNPEMNCLGSNGKEKESDSGHTAEHASEQNCTCLHFFLRTKQRTKKRKALPAPHSLSYLKG